MTLTEDERQQLKAIIGRCLNKIYAYDTHLITTRGMEQSAAFRFAIYLHKEMTSVVWLRRLNLDIEYNKNGLKPKKTPRRKKGTKPDLIVHRRTHNDENVLNIEFKGWYSKKSDEDDKIKLEDFTDQEGEYKYALGVFLKLLKNGCTPIYYINGEIQNGTIAEPA